MKIPVFKLWDKLTFRKTPLAWLQLSHQKIRLIVAIVGVAFSNILIFTQLGLRALLFDGITLVPQSLNGDLYLMSSFAENISRSSFPVVYLYQADAIEGVAAASPLFIGEGEWVNPESLKSSTSEKEKDALERKSFNVQILAFNPTQPVFNLPGINNQLDLLTVPDGILYDRLGQSQLGKIPQLFAEQGEVQTVMNNRRIRVVGLFSMGSTVMDEGHAVMSDWNYEQQGEEGVLDLVSVGVLALEPGVAPQAVIKRLKGNLTKDVKVMTKEELVQGEQDYIAQFPEGKILNFGAAIGFIVGVVIVYQVIYTDVSEHLPEYATLKAMGYGEKDLSLVVLQESLILAVMGFIPGFFASYGVYHLLESTTKIPLEMDSGITLQVFALTVFMCIISGAIAINKLRTADPADIFY
jgi:putative ABC transport system permease protein